MHLARGSAREDERVRLALALSGSVQARIKARTLGAASPRQPRGCQGLAAALAAALPPHHTSTATVINTPAVPGPQQQQQQAAFGNVRNLSELGGNPLGRPAAQRTHYGQGTDWPAGKAIAEMDGLGLCEGLREGRLSQPPPGPWRPLAALGQAAAIPARLWQCLGLGRVEGEARALL